MRHVDSSALSFDSLIEGMLPVVRQAGKAIMDIYLADSLSVDYKTDASPVTSADLAAHHCLVKGLQALLPNCPVVSEEDESSLVHRTKQGWFWLIDPLDGTKEFINKNGEFTVNVALIENGLPIVGVVFAPAINKMFWGGRAFGAFKQENETIVKLQLKEPRHSLRVVASKSHLNAATESFITNLGACELVQAGSSLKFCLIAEGKADIYPRLAPTCEWDTAAAQAVLEGVGGVVVQEDGQALTYGKQEVLNPSFIAHANVIWHRD